MNTKKLYPFQKIALRVGAIVSIAVLVACQSPTTQKVDQVKSTQVRTQLAAEYLRLGHLDAAKRSLDQALSQQPHDAMANMMMGVLLQQDGSPENLAKAEQYFKIALANEPQNMRIHANYGTYLFQMQRYELAIQHLTQAANHLGYEQRAAAYENLGRVYLHLQQFSSAEQAFRQALRIDAQASIAMFELAELLYLQQQFEAAQQWFERYVHSVGQRALGARAYWLGGRLARSLGNVSQQQSYFQMLQQQFAHSAEYQHYVRLKNSADVIWR